MIALGPQKTRVVNRCPFCGNVNSIEVDTAKFVAWQQGALIQNAFPDLTPDQREVIKTGICPKCWDDTFK